MSKKCTYLKSVIGTQARARRRSGAITMKSAVNGAKSISAKARSNDSAMLATGISTIEIISNSTTSNTSSITMATRKRVKRAEARKRMGMNQND